MEFSHRLYELRRQAGLSQEELAHLIGVTRQAVQKWEAGTAKPDTDNLALLADHFQVSLDYLVRGAEQTQTVQETRIIHHYHHRYEYKSKRTVRGLPLVHINLGPGLCRAKGIIAIGNIATGFISIGGLAMGVLSLGGLSLGLLLALGGISLGCAAVGGLAVGLLALGGLALGILTYGGISCGVYAVGGVAIGSQVAIGGVASAPVAVGAAAEGAQAFVVPLNGLQGEQLAAAQAAVMDAAPAWLGKLLCFIIEHGI